LAHRGACLSCRQVEWTLLQPDNAHSGGNRAAGDDDALASATNELRHIGSETAKLFVIECVGARSSKNAGAELEKNAPGFPVHAELLHKPETESAQKQFPRFYQAAIITPTEYRSRPTYIDTLKRQLADVTKQFDQLLAHDRPALNESLKSKGQQPIAAPSAKIRANDATHGSRGGAGAGASAD
jgi:hypothetical protein